MITYTLEGPAVLTLRASGTEPKLKWYLEASSEGDPAAAAALADALEEAVAAELVQPDVHGLTRPKLD